MASTSSNFFEEDYLFYKAAGHLRVKGVRMDVYLYTAHITRLMAVYNSYY